MANVSAAAHGDAQLICTPAASDCRAVSLTSRGMGMSLRAEAEGFAAEDGPLVAWALPGTAAPEKGKATANRAREKRKIDMTLR